ncbi:MAG: PQQ-binding-like beta-propeller repeat protein, partial [Pseudomonadales bacterium]|nr:PQQ-binding-like beta-propeller repeat protein [Pseudomonadales bacterium]
MTNILMRMLLVLCLFSSSVFAQYGAPDGQWPTYGGDLGHTRYSALNQIDAGNFSDLEVAWRFKTDNLGPAPEYRFQATPLMVDGIIYTTAGSRRAVVALDAETGELLWKYSMNEGERGAFAPRQLSGRGLAFWQNEDESTVIYVTPGYQMVALNADSGLPVETFGNNGVVDLKQNADQQIDLVTGEIGLHATPIVAKDVIIIGAAHRTG